MTLRWDVHPDGTFDLLTPGPGLCGCYPAIDGVAVRPLKVAATPSRITYTLSGGELVLELRIDGAEAVLATTLRGPKQAPHRVEPCVAEAPDAVRMFRQGLGFAGPSGLVDLDRSGALWSHDSTAVTALCDAAGRTLALAAADHRRFLQKCILRNHVGRYGLTNRHPDDRRVELDVAFHTERVPLPDGVLTLPELRFRYAERPLDALSVCAQAIADEMGARVASPPTYHWCSWYSAYHNLSLELLQEHMEAFRKLSPPLPMQAAQIDAGYYTHAGDWLEPNQLWPGGMRRAFECIEAAGFRPGIWVAPFMVGNRSRLATEHPDWILRDTDGRPVLEWHWYNGATMWGYRDEEYCPSTPATRTRSSTCARSSARSTTGARASSRPTSWTGA